MRKKKWRILTVLILCGLVVAGFVVVEQNNKSELVEENMRIEAEKKEELVKIEEQKKLEEQKRLESEAAEKEAERLEALEKTKAEEKAKADAKARQDDIEINTYFASTNGANIIDQPSATGNVLSKLPAKKSCYATEVVKNPAGEIEYLKVKSDIDAPEILGFISIKETKKTLSEFITKKYSDVDYSYYEKNEAFANNPKIDVKGIYVTGNSARGERLDELIALIDETELNAVVIDVNDDNGSLLFYSEAAARLNPDANAHIYIEDMDAFIAKMKAHDIYLIARIVTFKSPVYAKSNPDRAIVYNSSGKLYSDADGLIWASPYDRNLWEYNVALAKEAAAYGFNEIQFDYVRFPAIADQTTINYRNNADESQSAAIQNFLKYAYETLAPDEVYISADVFGWAASAIDDVGIGQQWESVSNVVDYICPMMYPSHYGPGNYGLSVPDAFPYETIDRSVKDALSRNANLVSPGGIRPWIQDFTAPWVRGHIRYRAKEVKAQIDALEANGINEYLVWNAGNFYSSEAFK